MKDSDCISDGLVARLGYDIRQNRLRETASLIPSNLVERY
jgi:hypothetical protein